MENELKPCPFCGGKARTSSGYSHVRCSEVDKGCPMSEEVIWIPIAAWNARAGAPDVDAGEVERLVDEYREAVLQHHTARLRYPDTLSVTAHSNRENIARASLLEYVSKGGK